MDIENDFKTFKILLVEDNPADRRMIQETFKDFKIRNHLYSVKDGVEALEFLNKKGKYKNAIHPDLILLDLNLPRMNGHEFLKKIKNDTRFKAIPVIILTICPTKDAISCTYKLEVEYFIAKPANFDGYQNVIQCIEEYCLNNPNF